MQLKKIIVLITCLSSPLYAAEDQHLQREIKLLQEQTQKLQAQLKGLQRQLKDKSSMTLTQGNVKKAKKGKTASKLAAKKRMSSSVPTHSRSASKVPTPPTEMGPHSDKKAGAFHSSGVLIHTPEAHPESIGFYPTALIADNHVVTYIAGTPVVSSPYLGDRPAFDGSDYIVNISSINRDIRLMQQRRRLYRAYESIGYPMPYNPIIAVSGKAEPLAAFNNPFRGNMSGDLNLGSSELDVAATLNPNVEAYIALAYDDSPPAIGPRIDNSAFNLNMGFVNIGNLDKTPFYFTGGQLYVPFGRYSTAMVSAPLTMNLARTKTRPFIFGYKSQEESGPFAAVYGYRSDTTLGKSGVGGVNLGYVFAHNDTTGEIGISYISTINDSAGMQNTNSVAGTTFGGFGSFTNGSEAVRKTPALDVHGNISFDRYILTGEWVGVTESFREQDLSFNGKGAKPQAVQGELDMTFTAFNRPASLGMAYQWTHQALALNLAQQRISGVFNISIWKDTVESIEYRHDIDYKQYQFANGAAPVGQVNENTVGTGSYADSVAFQVGVYF